LAAVFQLLTSFVSHPMQRPVMVHILPFLLAHDPGNFEKIDLRSPQLQPGWLEVFDEISA